MDELDHVLGLLREQEPGERSAQRTLGDLERLVAHTRSTGLPVAVEVAGAGPGLPPAVSREGYRIVQEGLTKPVRGCWASAGEGATGGLLTAYSASNPVAGTAGICGHNRVRAAAYVASASARPARRTDDRRSRGWRVADHRAPALGRGQAGVIRVLIVDDES
jgi:hypothetical protein